MCSVYGGDTWHGMATLPRHALGLLASASVRCRLFTAPCYP